MEKRRSSWIQKVLSAVGVKSNIENLGLEEVGVAIDNDKILVNDFYETNIPGYYAIGDITKGQALAHVASAEGILLKKFRVFKLNPSIIIIFLVVPTVILRLLRLDIQKNKQLKKVLI